jgi:hypothetical protein
MSSAVLLFWPTPLRKQYGNGASSHISSAQNPSKLKPRSALTSQSPRTDLAPSKRLSKDSLATCGSSVLSCRSCRKFPQKRTPWILSNPGRPGSPPPRTAHPTKIDRSQFAGYGSSRLALTQKVALVLPWPYRQKKTALEECRLKSVKLPTSRDGGIFYAAKPLRASEPCCLTILL